MEVEKMHIKYMVIGNHPLFQTREDLVFSQYKTIGL